MNKLSVVISAYNEEEKIEACLKSAAFADEIVVVDNSSTDKTGELARKYTKHVYTQKNDPSAIDIQKNFGIGKATGDWILVLDADEEVTPELAEEIKHLVIPPRPTGTPQEGNSSGTPQEGNSSDHPLPATRYSQADGFWVHRKNIIFGKWMEHTGWYPDPQLRLFKKGKGTFQEKHVHEPIAVEGKTEHLKEHILHHNFESVHQFLYKSLLVYAPNEADDLLAKGYIFDYKDIIKLPLKEFLSRYFAREGYKDGFHGLALSVLMGFYHLVVFMYLWEKKDFVQLSNEDAIAELKDEWKRSRKDLMYWISKLAIDREKSELKKIGLKIKKKIGI